MPQIDVMGALIEGGADINAPMFSASPEGAVDTAVGRGYIEVVRWMLQHGAQLNHEVDGERRCLALVSAAIDGNLEMAKLLVEHGADFNALWRGDNALSGAEKGSGVILLMPYALVWQVPACNSGA